MAPIDDCFALGSGWSNPEFPTALFWNRKFGCLVMTGTRRPLFIIVLLKNLYLRGRLVFRGEVPELGTTELLYNFSSGWSRSRSRSWFENFLTISFISFSPVRSSGILWTFNLNYCSLFLLSSAIFYFSSIFFLNSAIVYFSYLNLRAFSLFPPAANVFWLLRALSSLIYINSLLLDPPNTFFTFFELPMLVFYVTNFKESALCWSI